MRRTATHIITSPNPAQLEMRILANHGADNRFAFLRGRWSRAWSATKAKARLDPNKEKPPPQHTDTDALGGLSGYGASDDDSDIVTEETSTAVTATTEDVASKARESEKLHGEEALKEARRAKAREWAQKRRALKEGQGSARAS